MALFGGSSPLQTYYNIISQENSGGIPTGPSDGTGITLNGASVAPLSDGSSDGQLSIQKLLANMVQNHQAQQAAQQQQQPMPTSMPGGPTTAAPILPQGGQDAGQVAVAGANAAIRAAQASQQQAPSSLPPMPQGFAQGSQSPQGSPQGSPQQGQGGNLIDGTYKPSMMDYITTAMFPTLAHDMLQKRMMYAQMAAHQQFVNRLELGDQPDPSGGAPQMSGPGPSGAPPVQIPGGQAPGGSLPAAGPVAGGPPAGGLFGGGSPNAQAAAAASATPPVTPTQSALPSKQTKDWKKMSPQQLMQDPAFVAALNDPFNGPTAHAFLDDRIKAQPKYEQQGQYVRNVANPTDAIYAPSNIPEGAIPLTDPQGNVVGYKTAEGYMPFTRDKQYAIKSGENRSNLEYGPVTAAKTKQMEGAFTPQDYTDSDGAVHHGTANQSWGGTPGQPGSAGAGPNGSVPGMTGPTTFRTASDKAFADSYQKDTDTWKGVAQGADLVKDSIQRLRNLDKQFTSGILSDPNVVYRTADAVGIHMQKGLPAAQAYQQMVGNLLLAQKQNMGPGVRLAGPEIAFLEHTVPQVGNTPAGNKLIYDSIEKLAQKRAFIAHKRAEWDAKYRKKGGTMPDGTTFEQWANTWSENHPAFGK